MSNFLTIPEVTDSSQSDYLLINQTNKDRKITRESLASGLRGDLRLGTQVLNSASGTEVDLNYHITGTFPVTLPSTTGVSVGDKVTFTKDLSATPEIQVEGSNGENIETVRGSDTSVIFNINAEVIFIFNGINWEV